MFFHHALRASVRKILPDVVYLVTSSGTGSYTTPSGYNTVTIEAIGGGGNGFGGTSAFRAGGGGGAYARTENLSVTSGSTIVYYSVGGVASDSWVRVGTNSAPSSTTDGCLGYRGTSGASATAGVGGTTANSIGTAKYSGANGGVTGTPSGGGAGGQNANASGATGGGSGDMKGGNGGAYATGGNPGTAPGGGGSGMGSAGTPAGAIGRVRITFKQ